MPNLSLYKPLGGLFGLPAAKERPRRGIFTKLYQDAIPLHKRVYGESLLKAATGQLDEPITEADLSPEDLDYLQRSVSASYDDKLHQYRRPPQEMIAEADRKDKMYGRPMSEDLRRYAKTPPTDFAFGYGDYMDTGEFVNDGEDANWQDNPPLINTLGAFRYKETPQGLEVYDEYNFDNEPVDERGKVSEYAAMSPLMRAYSATKDFLGGARNSYGMAYLGDKGPKVKINLKR
jgi:hypothetical protein